MFLELAFLRTRIRYTPVISHSKKLYGLSTKEGHDSLSCLLDNGSVFNKPTQAGLTSLFVKEDFVEPDEEHHQSDSFSSSLENMVSKTKSPPRACHVHRTENAAREQ